MQAFEWSLKTKIIYINDFSQPGKILKGMGKRCSLITSPSYSLTGKFQSITNALVKNLKDNGIEATVFSTVTPHPKTELIDELAKEVYKTKPGFLIALGGGSVMDATKAIALLQKNEGPIWDYTYKGPGLEMKKFNSATPVVCIPTIAATGSEANSYAVLTHNDPIHGPTKSTLFGDALQPVIAILDPSLTTSLSFEQTRDSAFDIVCHALETYFSTEETSPLVDNLSFSIVKSVFESLEILQKNPSDLKARGDMMYASTLALCGILNGRDGHWPLHAIEHGISASTDISHGRGLAFLLPRLLKFQMPLVKNKFDHLNAAVFLNKSETLFSFMKKMGALYSWSDLGISEANLSTTVDKTISHCLRVDGVHEKSKTNAYLKNITPLFSKDIETILMYSPSEI